MTAAAAAYKVLCETHTLVVLDTETCPADDGWHIVSVAASVWQRGRERKLWATLVNPGVPITNTRHHGLTDDDVADAPSFDEIVADLEALLAEPDTVLACHNVAFDVGVLHLEYARLGTDQALPDVPVLDTMTLPKALDHAMPGRSRKLAAFCDAFGITNAKPHDAASDATATAEVLHALLRVATGQGRTDLSELWRDSGGHTTTSVPSAPDKVTREDDDRPELPAEHLATHAVLLGEKVTAAEVDRWITGAVECAKLRCRYFDNKARVAIDHAQELHPRLTAALNEHAAEFEPGQGATLVAGLNILAERGIKRVKSARPYVTWWQHNRATIAALPRCHAERGRCPDCHDGDACPIDVAHQPLARAVCFDGDDTIRAPRRRTISKSSEPSCFLARWTRLGLPELAGYAAWLTTEAWVDDRNPARADAVIDQAVEVGAHDPRIVRIYAARLALQGRHDDAEALIAEHMPRRTTDPGWHELAEWHRRYRAQQARRPTRREPAPDAPTNRVRPAGRVRPGRFVP